MLSTETYPTLFSSLSHMDCVQEIIGVMQEHQSCSQDGILNMSVLYIPNFGCLQESHFFEHGVHFAVIDKEKSKLASK